MPDKVNEMDPVKGLSQTQIQALQKQFGKNVFLPGSSHRFLNLLRDIFLEPMFILLLIACLLYFILGNTGEGIMMAIAIGIVTAISLYQEVRSSRALEALKQFTEP